MTVPSGRRFSAECLFAPASICLAGADSPEGRRILANLRQAGFPGDIATDSASLQPPPDLGIAAGQGADIIPQLTALAALGCRAAIVTGQIAPADLACLVRTTGLRILGPSSFGVASPKSSLNASLSHIPLPPGHVALVTQSAALARAVIDWAGPNGVGFSHVAGIGGNADLGFGAILDFLSRDPDTRLILLDIRRVRNRRAFISAARAASRLRPVVALRPGGLLLDETGRADAVFEAALTRAGVFTVHRLEAFLAAAETLTRSRPLRGDAMAIVTNAIGPGRLAADAALRAGITLAQLPPEAQQSLTASLPADLIYGLVYAGSAAPTDVASIAAMVSAVPEVGGVLVLLAPTGPGDAAAVESVIAAAHTAHLPVLTCVMGETTGAPLRRRLAEAGLPAFATPERAVEAFGHLRRDRHARLAARELPPSRVLEIAPDHAASGRILADAASTGRLVLTRRETLALLAAYGLPIAPPASGAPEPRRAVTLTVHDDPTFGPAIGLHAPAARLAYDLPPLNLVLARDLARRAGLSEPALADAAAGALVRVSQMLVDLPQMARLEIGQLLLGPRGAMAAEAASWLHPPGERSRLAISPYPDHLVHDWSSPDQAFVIRPIRPEDAAAQAAMVARVPPDDLRRRFFSAIRQVAPEQMARLTQIDYDREMAFIAVRTHDGATVGVSRLVREGPADDEQGEFAILVEPAAKGLGLARHLMDCLIGWARSQNLARITGQILADNQPMLGFVRHLGFSLRPMQGEPDLLEALLFLRPLP